jgi:hypothetical protein
MIVASVLLTAFGTISLAAAFLHYRFGRNKMANYNLN